MSKRKITQQQQRRIAEKQARILDTSTAEPGLVIAHHGKSLEVEDNNGKVIICKKRQHLGPIVPGDWIKWQLENGSEDGVAIAIEPRISLLSRPGHRNAEHAVAANIQQMFIVIAPTPAPNQTTVDRYLLAAELQNIRPILILNKEDLLDNIPDREQIMQFIKLYKDIGVTTLMISAKKHQHLDELYTYIDGNTNVFVGQSGVGKSSIISTLLPEAAIKTGELSNIDLGSHTTTTARLYHLPQLHGDIIDSPGMREFPLWQQDLNTIASGFVEFKPFLHNCKYRNCLHVHEPGCALRQAAEEGKISSIRLASYQKILAEMQNNIR
jgi:ribosome biogenesis GTPase